MEETLHLTEEKHDEILVIKMRGRLDALSSPHAEEQVFSHIHQGENKIILELGGIDFLSSAGMRMLLSTSKKLEAIEGGKLIVAALTGNPLDVLKLSGFEHTLHLAPNVEGALFGFSREKA